MSHILAADIRPGDVLLAGPDAVACTVLREPEPGVDRYTSLPVLRFWSRREDTGEEGYLTYGPAGYARRADRVSGDAS